MSQPLHFTLARRPGSAVLRGPEHSDKCSVGVALSQAQEFLEKYLIGIWGRSLHHSGEVHSSVGVLIRRRFDDKHDTKIQAFVVIIFLAVTCYSVVIKDEYLYLVFRILGLWHCLLY